MSVSWFDAEVDVLAGFDLEFAVMGEGTRGVHCLLYVHIEIEQGREEGGMARCLRNAARRFQFPASAAGGQVPVPLSFTPLP